MGIIAGVAFGIAFSQVGCVIVRSGLASPSLLPWLPSPGSLPGPPGPWERLIDGVSSLLISPQVICLLIFLLQLK